MSLYPYLIPTTFGYSYPYTTETNVSVYQPPNTVVLINQPHQETLNSSRFYVIQPVTTGGMLSLIDGTTMPISAIEQMVGRKIDTASNGAPIFMGHPVELSQVKNPEQITTMMLPGQLIAVWVIVLVCIVILVGALAIISNSWVAVNQQNANLHAYDVAAQSQDIKEREYINTSTGDVHTTYTTGDTIERRTLNNGEIIDIPLNQAGQTFNQASCGKSVCVQQQGIDTSALYDKLLDQQTWKNLINVVILGVAAVAGIYVVAKVVPGLLSRKQQYPQYYPPPKPS